MSLLYLCRARLGCRKVYTVRLYNFDENVFSSATSNKSSVYTCLWRIFFIHLQINLIIHHKKDICYHSHSNVRNIKNITEKLLVMQFCDEDRKIGNLQCNIFSALLHFNWQSYLHLAVEIIEETNTTHINIKGSLSFTIF